MKIVCDNCATKYSIADEKVRGKVFKIRCKKCSHIIVVRGGADGNAEPSREPAPAADAGFPGDAGGAAAAASSDAVWHLVIDREQVGPMTPAEVRQKFADGAVDVETYAWREGFGDWLRLGSIDDFRDLGGAAAPDEGATRRTDSADLFAAAGGSDDAPSESGPADLFGGAPAPAPAAFSSAPAPSEDVFGGGGGGALFAAPAAAPAPSRPARTSSPGFAASASAEPAASSNVVDVRPMTGQRNENSVLFSLNNLQALATGGGGAKAAPSSASEPRPGFANSATEGSGLIDIRAMAASTLAASPASGGPSGKGDDLPGLGAAPVFSPMAAPILMPAAPSGPPKWMWAILGVGVLAVVGIIVVGALLLARKPDAPVVAALPQPALPAPGANPAAAAPAAAAPTAAAPSAAAPAAAAPAAEAAKEDAKAAKHDHKGAHEKGTKVAKNDAPKAAEPAAAAPAAAAAAPAAPAPKKGGKHDELDDLLNGASPGDAPKAKRAAARASSDDEGGGGAAAAENLPDQLDKGAIVGGMNRIKGRVAGCYDQYKVPGLVNVSTTIAGSGHVSNATVSGSFAGTPTGECVARVVKGASFPRFKGSPQTITYPFILR
jgi:predicted Zn finger-like uncharacterized protein